MFEIFCIWEKNDFYFFISTFCWFFFYFNLFFQRSVTRFCYIDNFLLPIYIYFCSICFYFDRKIFLMNVHGKMFLTLFHLFVIYLQYSKYLLCKFDNVTHFRDTITRHTKHNIKIMICSRGRMYKNLCMYGKYLHTTKSDFENPISDFRMFPGRFFNISFII